jgi:D-threo-aldose 1-dehydrogenase
VCHTHDVALPAAALQFILANPLVVSVIPGGQTVSETRHNAAVLDASIPPALWGELKDKKLLHSRAPTPG